MLCVLRTDICNYSCKNELYGSALHVQQYCVIIEKELFSKFRAKQN